MAAEIFCNHSVFCCTLRPAAVVHAYSSVAQLVRSANRHVLSVFFPDKGLHFIGHTGVSATEDAT